jgi:hypothetical protein
MNERIALPARRVITPVTAFLIGIALLAAVALGFGLRAWTENSSSTSSSASTAAVAPTHETLSARDEATQRTVAAAHRATTFAITATTAATTPRALRERSYR